MIDSVKQIKTMKAIDLPPTFDVQVGPFTYPMEMQGAQNGFVYFLSTSDNQLINVPQDFEMTVLVPDTWENARFDVEFDLMQKGIV